MIRRTVLAAVALVALAGAATPAFADVFSTGTDANQGVCLLGTNHSTGARDGICVWIPDAAK